MSAHHANGAMPAAFPSHASATGCSAAPSAEPRSASGLPKYWNTMRSSVATTSTADVRRSAGNAPSGGRGSAASQRASAPRVVEGASGTPDFRDARREAVTACRVAVERACGN
jgi:hypothetical protein